MLGANQPEKAEEIVAQGSSDYPNWRFETEANLILIGAAVQKRDYEKALTLADKVLGGSPKPEAEVQVLFLKGTVLRAKAADTSNPKLADEAFGTFQVVRDKFPGSTQAEDA